MEVMDALLRRRSVRKYTSDPVSDEILEDILKAGVCAPSAVNRQPWYFVAIRSREQMDLLMAVMDYVSQKIEPGLKQRFKNYPDVVQETTAFIRRLGSAPVCILAFRFRPDESDAALGEVQSIAAAIENILLAAVGKGLGGCWLTAPVEAGIGNQLRDTFAPGKGPLVAMLTIGYPEAIPPPPARKSGRYVII